jgi:hypothetical protein
MTPMKEVKERLKTIKRGLSAVKGVRVFHDVPKYAYLQGLLSMGDRRTGRLIEALSKGPYAPSQVRAAGIVEDFYIFRKKEFNEILPWDFIDAGVSKEKLWEEYLKATGT